MRLNKAALLRESVKQKTDGGRKKVPRVSRQLPPDPVMRAYRTELRKMVYRLQYLANLYLISKLPELTKTAEDDQRPTVKKVDAVGGDIHTLVDQMRIQFEQEYTEQEIRAMANRAGLSTAEWNARQMNRSFSRVASVNLFGGERWLGEQMEIFAIGNVNLIESIPERFFTEIETLTLQGVTEGRRSEDLAAEIRERYDVSESRANLLARDQIGKLNGQLNELRQAEVGVEEYIWRGIGDSRERESHLEKNGETFRWDDPPADTGHPGQDYQCRCWAEPVIKPLENSDEE